VSFLIGCSFSFEEALPPPACAPRHMLVTDLANAALASG
jgi:uncharacterized protein YcsI (UPF0317 family)